MFKKATTQGFGLIEVLVVLAIVATSMLAATQITFDGLRSIKLDEVVDYVNGSMLQALEIAKSPTSVEVVGTTAPANFDGSYRLQITPDGKGAMNRVTTATTPLTLANCSSSSPYFVNVQESNAVQNPLVCLQLVVTQKQNLGLNYYEVRSRIVYNLAGLTVEKEIVGYRRNSFTFRAI